VCFGGLSPRQQSFFSTRRLSPGDPAINMGRVTQAPQLESPFVVKRERKRVSRAGGPLAGSRRRLLSSCCSLLLSGLRCGYEPRGRVLLFGGASGRKQEVGVKAKGEGGVRDARAREYSTKLSRKSRKESDVNRRRNFLHLFAFSTSTTPAKFQFFTKKPT
jgi:hypothetical protein